eukprot:TRINITY_DN39176_c0_g1_i1.p1 TRINITY_DN39176_c0_g1~~TRINITY_DN39176_c0_g1_i1.p1  ORF type:complete len:787 (+),score=141.38 TRINITY_DN39176_c0_g1_i1:117-2477(+)
MAAPGGGRSVGTVRAELAAKLSRLESRRVPGVYRGREAGGPEKREPNCLFVSNLPSSASVAEVRELFSPYGDLAEVSLSAAGARRTARVRYTDEQGAIRAAAALHHITVAVQDGSSARISVTHAVQRWAPQGTPPSAKLAASPAGCELPGDPWEPSTGLVSEGIRRDPCTVYIRGLPRDLTDGEVTDLCRRFGVLASVTVRRPAEDDKRGPFAFARYYSAAEAGIAAVALRSVQLPGGQRLHTDTAHAGKEYPSIPIRLGSAPAHPPDGTDPYCACIRNWPESLGEEQLTAVCSPFGEIASVRIHRSAGRDPVCFVRFRKWQDASCAVWHLDNQPVHGQALLVGHSNLRPGGGQAVAALEQQANAGPLQERRENMLLTAAVAGGPPPFLAPDCQELDPCTLYVRNLPSGADEAQIRTVFEWCGEIDAVRTTHAERAGKGSDCRAWVRFRFPAAARYACSCLDGQVADGATRALSVVSSNRHAAPNAGEGYTPPFASGCAALHCPPGRDPFCLYVRNLPLTADVAGDAAIDDSRLRAIFSPFGEVATAAVRLPTNAVSGDRHGWVRFRSALDARSAVHFLDGNELLGTRISVTYNRIKPPRPAAGPGDAAPARSRPYPPQEPPPERPAWMDKAAEAMRRRLAAERERSAAAGPPLVQQLPVVPLELLGMLGVAPIAPGDRALTMIPGAVPDDAAAAVHGEVPADTVAVPRSVAEVAALLDPIPSTALAKDGDPHTFLVSRARACLGGLIGTAAAAEVPKEALRSYLGRRSEDAQRLEREIAAIGAMF